MTTTATRRQGPPSSLDVRALLCFFALAYAWSWAWVIPFVVADRTVYQGRGWPTHFPSLIGPLVAAFVVTAWTTRRAGVLDLVRRMGRWRIGWRWWVAALSPVAYFVLALAGLLLAYFLYRRGLASPDEDPLETRLGKAAPVFGNAYYFDAGISRLVGGPGRALAGWLDRVVDNKVIDGTVNGVGGLAKLLSRGVQDMQNGMVRRYALAIGIGLAGVLLYAVLWIGR